MRALRAVLLALLAADILVVSLLVAADPVMLKYPGGEGFVLRAFGGLFAYAPVVVWATSVRRRSRAIAVATGALFGAAGGGLACLLQAQERFAPLGSPSDGRLSLAVMVVVFLLWGAAGYRAIWVAGRRLSAAIAGPWAGCVTMTLAVTCQLAMALVAAPGATQVAGWIVFRDSGWSHAGAFATAHALDNAFTQMCAGPSLGLLIGTAGGALARFAQHRHAHAHVHAQPS